MSMWKSQCCPLLNWKMLGWVKVCNWRTGRRLVHTQPGSPGNSFLESTSTEMCQIRHRKNCVLKRFRWNHWTYNTRLGNEVFATHIQRNPVWLVCKTRNVTAHKSHHRKSERAVWKSEPCPAINKAFLRQDNAGCYNSSAVIAWCTHMKANTEIDVCRVNFSASQGGKGACDRELATIKTHVVRYRLKSGPRRTNCWTASNRYPV